MSCRVKQSLGVHDPSTEWEGEGTDDQSLFESQQEQEEQVDTDIFDFGEEDDGWGDNWENEWDDGWEDKKSDKPTSSSQKETTENLELAKEVESVQEGILIWQNLRPDLRKYL